MQGLSVKTLHLVLAGFALFMVVDQAYGQARVQWVLVGKAENTTLHVNPNAIERQDYRTGTGPTLVQRLETKTYRQTWMMENNTQGRTIRQYFWVFDCAGRAGELAASDLVDPSKSYDNSYLARNQGIEPHLQLIPPVSVAKNAQDVVCK